MILYMSTDDGALYHDVDDPTAFDLVDVNEPVTLTPEQLCGADGSIVEILLRAGQARIVQPTEV